MNASPARRAPARMILGRPVSNRRLVHFLSQSSEWSTPQWLFAALNAEFHFTLDPCASVSNAKCSRFYTRKEDGLVQDWKDHTVFMNPPYGRAILQWMRKAYESAKKGAMVVCLVPARTDTRWWHEFAMKGEIRLLRGRLRFSEARHSAPFPSAVVIFRTKRPHIRPRLMGRLEVGRKCSLLGKGP